MTIEEHTHKAQLILDNTRELYDREQAIFKVYFKRGSKDDFERQLKNFALDVVAKTNLLESADPHMHGETAEAVANNLVEYMRGEYVEFCDYQENAHDVKYATESEDNTERNETFETLYTGTPDGCFVYILKAQGQSVDYAIKYGGYSIVPREMIGE